MCVSGVDEGRGGRVRVCECGVHTVGKTLEVRSWTTSTGMGPTGTGEMRYPCLYCVLVPVPVPLCLCLVGEGWGGMDGMGGWDGRVVQRRLSSGQWNMQPRHVHVSTFSCSVALFSPESQGQVLGGVSWTGGVGWDVEGTAREGRRDGAGKKSHDADWLELPQVDGGHVRYAPFLIGQAKATSTVRT